MQSGDRLPARARPGAPARGEPAERAVRPEEPGRDGDRSDPAGCGHVHYGRAASAGQRAAQLPRRAARVLARPDVRGAAGARGRGRGPGRRARDARAADDDQRRDDGDVRGTRRARGVPRARHPIPPGGRGRGGQPDPRVAGRDGLEDVLRVPAAVDWRGDRQARGGRGAPRDLPGHSRPRPGAGARGDGQSPAPRGADAGPGRFERPAERRPRRQRRRAHDVRRNPFGVDRRRPSPRPTPRPARSASTGG